MPEKQNYQTCAWCRARSDANGVYETCKSGGRPHEWQDVVLWTPEECARKVPTRPDWIITDEQYASWPHAIWSQWHIRCPLWYLWLPDPKKRGEEYPIGYNREDALLARLALVEAAGTPYRVQVIRNPDGTLLDLIAPIEIALARNPIQPKMEIAPMTETKIEVQEPVQAVGPSTTEAAPAKPVDPTPTEAPTEVSIETFAQVDLRVGTVTTAEPVPKSRNLLRLLVDLGEAEPRQILAGIAGSVSPQDIIGTQIVVVANLPPRKMMGLVSRGMVIAASDGTGASVIRPSKPVPNGTRLR